MWKGKLDFGSVKLRLEFDVKKKDSLYISTFRSPDQDARKIPVEKTFIEDGFINFVISQGLMTYRAKLSGNDSIVGEFKQGKMTIPLVMSRNKHQKYPDERKRTQTPHRPFLYEENEVKFKNINDGVTLAGTFTKPPYLEDLSAVVLISGSGAHDRDCEIKGHKPFYVLSDYLTRRGIAVLRYDDRGVGESEGSIKDMTTRDLSEDAKAAFDFLRKQNGINPGKVGFIGHSEGGLIASMLAAKYPEEVAFVVLMASPGIKGDSLILSQIKNLSRVENVSENRIWENSIVQKELYALAREGHDDLPLKVKERFEAYWDEIPEYEKPQVAKKYFVSSKTALFLSPWFQFFINYDPQEDLINIKCPVFSINGKKDIQVEYKCNQQKISEALTRGGNDRLTIKSYDDLNHMFQECSTGSPKEYSQIEQTISPKVLTDIVKWIKKVTH